jgi:L-seryl-tRNA(Ser) seleniumtransferase
MQFGSTNGSLSEPALTTLLQSRLEALRARIAGGEHIDRNAIEADIKRSVAVFNNARLAPIINATGVVVHTNLGRAPVSQAASEAMSAAAENYVALEIDLQTGERGGRMSEISQLMNLLTGAETTLVVNNNAAAVLLTLSAVASGGSVVVSRGEAIEIGGGFRIPDVLAQSGAKLTEVGTTNRTYPRDYQVAIDETTRALLKVHPSNFTISGFATEALIEDLAPIANGANVPVIADLGSGALTDTTQFGLKREPTIASALNAGATIVTASGDKLIGGPQAGIIVGNKMWIDRIAAHPLARALRADKTCLAGLAATLRHYIRGEETDAIPIWRMISAPLGAVRQRAEAIVRSLDSPANSICVEECRSTVGGGSLPGETLHSFAVTIQPETGGVAQLAAKLRTGEPGVFSRIEKDRLWLDLRTVMPEQDEILSRAIGSALESSADPN